jgi:hypothetical protein
MQSAPKLFDPALRSRVQDDLDYAVGQTVADLERVARGDHIAWVLSGAMARVDADYRKTVPISNAQRDELLAAVVRAHLGAIEHLPKSYPRAQIDAGMQALAGQVMVWAETREKSALRKRHALIDIDAYARMFRNDMHNVSLLEEIERRAWERRRAHSAAAK